MSSIVSKKFDAVQANSIWEEAIKRENRLTKLGDTFQITDAKKYAVSEATAVLNTMSVVKDTDQAPHERYALPVTANMEYGFFSHKPLVPTNPMFDHRTKKVDVTAYGELYVKTAGTGPFNKTG